VPYKLTALPPQGVIAEAFFISNENYFSSFLYCPNFQPIDDMPLGGLAKTVERDL
jgi:hypothetical protein